MTEGGDPGVDCTVDCTICMCEVELPPNHPPDYMVCPCDHLFHAECLRRWMDVKQECPTCRAPLPAP